MNPVVERSDRVPLHGRASRKQLGRLVAALFEHWAISAADQALLLGLSARSRSTVARYRRGAPLGDSVDRLARAGHLLAIHEALCLAFPHDRDLAYRWVTTPNRRFGSLPPLEVMRRDGFEGVLAIRGYLEFERGR